jgi:hypothetical protein
MMGALKRVSTVFAGYIDEPVRQAITRVVKGREIHVPG